MKLNKFLLSIVISSFAIAQNINYVVSDIHTLTIPKNQLTFKYTYLLMNDTVDILKIKESEFGNNSSFDAIGDLQGASFNIRYGITNDLMVDITYKKENIQYSSNTLKNTQYDMFFRHNLFHYPYTKLNSGLSFDIGYVTNKLEDFYIDDLQQINDLGNKISTAKGLSTYTIKTSPRDPSKYDIFDSLGAPIVLSSGSLTKKPWIALKDTKDESYYFRLLTGYYTKNSIFDFYIGYRQISINNLVTTTEELLIEARNNPLIPTLEQSFNRDEKMYMAGFNYTLESKSFIYEFNFEYDKFIRDEGLDYIDFNYIIDTNIAYKINQNTLFFVGAKIMYRQLNGEIPYLYNEYSQTSYDHKYGYTRMGLQYIF